MATDFAPHNLTSATGGGFTVTCSTDWPGLDCWRAFEGHTQGNTQWTSEALPAWLQIQCPASHTLHSYGIQARFSGEGDLTRMPRDFTMQGSNDGSNWTVIDTRTGITGWSFGAITTFTLSSPAGPYTYFRLNVTDEQASGDGLCEVEELYLYEESTTPITKSADDTIALSDVSALSYGFSFPIAEAIELTDAATEVPIVPILIEGDAIDLSDDIIQFSTYLFSDILSITDLADILIISNKKKVWEILVGDTLVLGDIPLGLLATYVTAVGDSYSIVDSVTSEWTRGLSFSDTISLADSSQPLLSFYDGIALSDGLSYDLLTVQPTAYFFLIEDGLAIGEDTTLIAIPELLFVGDSLELSDLVVVRNRGALNNYLRRYLNDVPTPIS